MNINLPRILSFVIIAVVIAGVVNVYADAGPIERAARQVACDAHRSAACRLRLGRVARSPLFHDLQFTDGGRTVDVRCHRSLYLVGDFTCALHAP